MTDTAESQDDVFAFLGRASTHGGADVRRIDTHAAVVFLAGERAFKVKRAVRFPFLDFSTLEKRRDACTAEIEANRPFAPELYRARRRRHARVGRCAWRSGATGEPVEYAVEMRRFDETKTLDRLADDGAIDLVMADSSRARSPRPTPGRRSSTPRRGSMRLPTMSIRTTPPSARTPHCFPPLSTSLTGASRAALSRLRPLLLARGKAGLVRRGHGDLHLGNIALIDGRPVPFDALEFDPLVASGDVLYDLAFLLMDLVERSLQPAANVVLNRYLVETQASDDLDALAALPFLMSMRAAIRAKVTAARAAVAPAVRSRCDRNSRRRPISSWRATLIAPPPPRLVAVGGLSGTGKSVLARALAPDLMPAPGAVVLRSDIERKALFGVAETERLPADAYTPDVTARTYAVLADKARR